MIHDIHKYTANEGAGAGCVEMGVGGVWVGRITRIMRRSVGGWGVFGGCLGAVVGGMLAA